jgi:L-threonine kinase
MRFHIDDPGVEASHVTGVNVPVATDEPHPLRTGPSGVGSAFGTFGELLQGALPGSNLDFLVTLPIARGTLARFTLDQTTRSVRTEPAGKRKAQRLAESMLRQRGLRVGGTLVVDSELPEGKGLASSSADLVATARAVGHCLGYCPDPSEISALLRPIEPSDGVMYDGAVAFYHRQVRLLAELGELPPMTIVGIDEGGTVDTIGYNQTARFCSRADKLEYGRLFDLAASAIKAQDVNTIGEVATRSAFLHQRRQPKRFLTQMSRIATRIGALGVVTAHSGTVLGLLLAERDPLFHDRLRRAARECTVLAGTFWLDQTQRRPPASARGVPGRTDHDRKEARCCFSE